ncbi:MAG: polyprenyl synthetase family protein, partial [Bacillota bacterium]
VGALLSKATPFSDDTIAQLKAVIDETGGVLAAQRLAKRYTKKALTVLNKLPDGDYKTTLKHIITDMLERTL